VGGGRRQQLPWRLSFEGGRELDARIVILNVPRPALQRIGGVQEAVGPERWSALTCTARAFPPELKEGATTTKVYAVYEDAWWISKLALLRGVRENMTTTPTVAIHYHDGEVLCEDGEPDAGGATAWRPARETESRGRCRGVLQVFYRHSQSCPSAFPDCMEFWAGLPRANYSDPVTEVRSGSGVVGDKLLGDVHRKLMEMHGDELAAANATQASIRPPTALLYSVWYHDGTFPARDARLLTGPQDLIYGDGAAGLPASCGRGAGNGPLAAAEWDRRVLGTGAWAADGLHVVNNDFAATRASKWHGPWAEASLLAAERLLARAFGRARPAWLNATYYERQVLRAPGVAAAEAEATVPRRSSVSEGRAVYA